MGASVGRAGFFLVMGRAFAFAEGAFFLTVSCVRAEGADGVLCVGRFTADAPASLAVAGDAARASERGSAVRAS